MNTSSSTADCIYCVLKKKKSSSHTRLKNKKCPICFAEKLPQSNWNERKSCCAHSAQSPGGAYPHSEQCVFPRNNVYVFSTSQRVRTRGVLEGEQRQEKTNKPSVSLACLAVTHCLHSQNKQDYLKHQASSSSAELLRPHGAASFQAWEKMNPGSNTATSEN